MFNVCALQTHKERARLKLIIHTAIERQQQSETWKGNLKEQIN